MKVEFENSILYKGNALDVLKQLESNSVDCVVTSPPYFQLRRYDGIPDYIWDGDSSCEHEFGEKIIQRQYGNIGTKPGVGNQKNDVMIGVEDKGCFCVKCGAWKGQLGLEPNYKLYISHLTEIINECKRVLKETGTMWINIADTYSGGRPGSGGMNTAFNYTKKAKRFVSEEKINWEVPKMSLMMIPHRFAMKCVDDLNLILRNTIIWASYNKMPESVTNRLSKKYEFMFFFVKNSKKYYFNLDSIREETDTKSVIRNKGAEGYGKVVGWSDYNRQTNHENGKNPGDVSDFWKTDPYSNLSKYSTIEEESAYRQGMNRKRGFGIIEKRPYLPSQEIFVNSIRENFTIEEIVEKTGLSRTKVEHWFRLDQSGFSYPSKEDWELLETDLWSYELCTVIYESDGIEKNIHKGKKPGDVSDFWNILTKPSMDKHYAQYNTDLIYKPIMAGCPEGGIVLDPFGGTGTTGVMARNLNRKFIGIDGSDDYFEISCEKMKNFVPYINTKLEDFF